MLSGCAASRFSAGMLKLGWKTGILKGNQHGTGRTGSRACLAPRSASSGDGAERSCWNPREFVQFLSSACFPGQRVGNNSRAALSLPFQRCAICPGNKAGNVGILDMLVLLSPNSQFPEEKTPQRAGTESFEQLRGRSAKKWEFWESGEGISVCFCALGSEEEPREFLDGSLESFQHLWDGSWKNPGNGGTCRGWGDKANTS